MAADNSLFGQIVLSKGWIDEQKLDQLLAAQRDTPPGLRLALGQMLLQAGLLTGEQVAEALAIQRRMRQAHAIHGYELLARIASGGMGTVYKARKEGIDKIVALKILSPALARNQDYIARFFREARAAGMLNHPNIVAGFDVGESGGYYYFAMEYAEGETVADILAREGRIPEDRALNIISQVAAGLEHAHAHGIVHRDIKPENIIVTPSGLVKLTDLGLAKGTSADASVTQDGHTIGTPYYASPEQARGDPDVDGRSDIYSLGATLFHMAAGRVPFTGNTPAAILARHITEELPSLYQLKADFSEPVARLIKKMMAKDPARRHASPAEVIEEIRRALIQKQTVEHPEPVAQPVPERRRRAWPLATAGAALAAGAIIAAVLLTQGQDEPPAAPPPNAGTTQPPRPVPDPALAAAEKLLAEADDFAQRNPAAYGEIIARYLKVQADAKGTPSAAAAAERLAAARRKLGEVRAAFLDKLRSDAGALAKAGKFGEAMARVEADRAAAAALGAGKQIDNELSKVKGQAAAALADKSAQADKLLEDGQLDEAREVAAAIAAFGLKDADDRAKAILARINAAADEQNPPDNAEERRRDNDLRARIYAVGPLAGALQLDKARQAYAEIRPDCTEAAKPLLDERVGDLEILAGLKAAIIESANAKPTLSRSIKLATGKSFIATCAATDEALTIKASGVEMKVGWDKLSPDTLSDLARAAAADKPLSLALLAHYSGNTAEARRLLADAEGQAGLAEQAAALRRRVEAEAAFHGMRNIRERLPEAEKLVEEKKADKAAALLKQLRQVADESGNAEVAAKLDELIARNDENAADAEIDRATAESKNGNWREAAAILTAVKENYARTKALRSRLGEVDALLAQAEAAAGDPALIKAVRTFALGDDAAARAAFLKISRERKGTADDDAKSFVGMFDSDITLPRVENHYELMSQINRIPDPWQRLAAYRLYRKTHTGTNDTAEIRRNIGRIFRDDLNRPAWGREVFQTIVEEYARDKRWSASALLEIGQCEQKAGNWAEAEKTYDSIPRKYASEEYFCAYAMSLKAQYYMGKGKNQDALDILEDAVAKYPFGNVGTSRAQYILGSLYRDAFSKPEKALEAFKGVYFRTPKELPLAPMAMASAADVLILLGRKQEARDTLGGIVAQFPDTAYADRARQKLETLR